MKRITVIALCVLFMAQGCIVIVPGGGPVQSETWEQLSPGMSTKDEVISALGEPQTAEVSEEGEILEYPTQNEGMPNYVVVKDGVVQYTSMIVPVDERKSLAEAIQKYGEPEKITYSPFMHGARTYVYATQGVTLIVFEGAGVVYRKQRYTPMSLDEYMRTWGKNLPLENPYIK